VQVQVDELGHGLGRLSLPQPGQRKTVRLCGFRGLDPATASVIAAIYRELLSGKAALRSLFFFKLDFPL